MASCTNKVDNEETVNIPISKEESLSLKLKSHVTSGIAVCRRQFIYSNLLKKRVWIEMN